MFDLEINSFILSILHSSVLVLMRFSVSLVPVLMTVSGQTGHHGPSVTSHVDLDLPLVAGQCQYQL